MTCTPKNIMAIAIDVILMLLYLNRSGNPSDFCSGFRSAFSSLLLEVSMSYNSSYSRWLTCAILLKITKAFSGAFLSKNMGDSSRKNSTDIEQATKSPKMMYIITFQGKPLRKTKAIEI